MAMRSPGCMARTSARSFSVGVRISQMPSLRKRAVWSSVCPKLAPKNQVVVEVLGWVCVVTVVLPVDARVAQ